MTQPYKKTPFIPVKFSSVVFVRQGLEDKYCEVMSQTGDHSKTFCRDVGGRKTYCGHNTETQTDTIHLSIHPYFSVSRKDRVTLDTSFQGIKAFPCQKVHRNLPVGRARKKEKDILYIMRAILMPGPPQHSMLLLDV